MSQTAASVALYRKLSDVEEKQIHDALTKSRIQMLLNFPFFGILSLHLELTVDYGIHTAATDGEKFYYNPHFIKRLSDGERNWIVIHEVMHPALKHLWRRQDREMEKWNYACDYSIHDVIMQFLETADYRIKDKLKMPPGCLYDEKYKDKSAEQIYDMLPKDYKKNAKFGNGGGNQNQQQKGQGGGSGQQGQQQQGQGQGGGAGEEDEGGQTPLDDHSRWNKPETQANGQEKATDWEGKIISAAKAAESKNAGSMPGFLQRLLNKLTKPQKDWRTLLAEFVQQEVDDYSFAPPDRRFSDQDFFLPDFNDTCETVKDIYFMTDTSGSISDRELSVFYSEIVGAINQFKRLTGKLGFFDHICYGVTPFEDVTDVLQIRPKGGGGTCFHSPFKWINDNVKSSTDSEIAGIVILTDGYADWPPESIANGVPVLWVITNEDRKPPWGLHTQLKI
jgi:predicted metal-dependent peptidase